MIDAPTLLPRSGHADPHAAAAPSDAELDASIEAACSEACRAIAPAWPLDRSIAVNPHWSRIGMPVRRVAARMALLGGIQVFPPRDRQRSAWDAGRIRPEDVEHAVSQVPEAQARSRDPRAWAEALRTVIAPKPLPLLVDVLDKDPHRHTRLSWRQAITHQVSQTCAAYFDRHQADWQPARAQGLYAFWRESLQHDHSIGLLMGLPQIDRAIDALPATARDAERWVLRRIGLPPAVWADYLEAVLLTINGWASWCAYQGWQAGLEGRTDPHLRELLAIRLAWGTVLLECQDDAAAQPAFRALQRAWGRASRLLELAERDLLVDEVWQSALEAGYQRTLAHRLAPACAPADALPAPDAEVQALFCIDVRSEPLRHALETAWPAVRTMGFAGFFGLPMAYTPLATPARRPQLPGLLSPAIEATDRLVTPGPQSAEIVGRLQGEAARSRHRRLALDTRWADLGRWPGAAFSFVEAAGFGYLAKLGQWLAPARRGRPHDDLAGLPARYRPLCRPRLTGLDPADQVALAERLLRAMGLDRGCAPLVVFVGHGSQSANNAHAAALDCGACAGQTGESNARSLAALLNESAVRDGLRARGIDLPESTVFMAALHNTATDEIESFDLDLLPPAARERWGRLRAAFDNACDRLRRVRAPGLGLDATVPSGDLLQRLRRRANDGAQTRPEWGLAGNAAFLIAPRRRSRGLSLDGRVFLHDYDPDRDADGSLLEQLMTAPMLVTHWINWQYHASTCDPDRLGSGNKVLHNVVGGNLGVFEGNGGDLRIGLSRQSLHDGTCWIHEPVRLTAVVDAPRQAIDMVVAKHATVARLVENGWMHLWRFAADGLERWTTEGWQPVRFGDS
jgi:uncharacterized protein YbcC (UPF0753/DUF2309 family)